MVDSERILTQLRIEGYDIVPTYQDADMVVVNTCGFIDEAKQESLDTIGEAINENGKVLVTGCMGANAQDILKVHPAVLDVSGPQAYEQVVGAVQRHFPYQRCFDDVISNGLWHTGKCIRQSIKSFLMGSSLKAI